MYIVNFGQIKTNKPITEEAKEIIEAVIGENDLCDVGGDVIQVDEVYDRDFDVTIENLIEKIKPMGYVLDGDIDYSGDYEGVIAIRANEVEIIPQEEMAIRNADDNRLIREIESRGYTVTKRDEVIK